MREADTDWECREMDKIAGSKRGGGVHCSFHYRGGSVAAAQGLRTASLSSIQVPNNQAAVGTHVWAVGELATEK